VNTLGIPAGFTNDPVYTEPLYVSNITMVDQTSTMWFTLPR